MEAASDKKTPTSYSFSCSGWLQCYQYGVGKALQELNLHQDAISLGASAGTLAAMTLTINKDFDVMLHHLQRGCTLAHAAIRNIFRISEYVEELMRELGLHEPGAVDL
ncbi:hypothetical protein AeMF1_015762 [Aphanomyces euteiches]|nr:hypothetical protein AeMF1_015762 [Aphanomyces euteiches]